MRVFGWHLEFQSLAVKSRFRMRFAAGRLPSARLPAAGWLASAPFAGADLAAPGVARAWSGSIESVRTRLRSPCSGAGFILGGYYRPEGCLGLHTARDLAGWRFEPSGHSPLGGTTGVTGPPGSRYWADWVVSAACPRRAMVVCLGTRRAWSPWSARQKDWGRAIPDGRGTGSTAQDGWTDPDVDTGG